MEPGTLIANRFRIDREIGKGGMGEVFAATNVQTGEAVALKLLRAEVKARRVSMERFRREARAGGFIKSDYVTEILEVDQDPERGIVLVFELLEGESLIERLKRTGPIHFTELWSIVECIWMGLHDAHTAGIIHRDLKPSNIFLSPRDKPLPPSVKLLDFGISKLPREVIVETLTRVGQSLGTFSFMPPEQIGKAKEVDERADIYSAATLIFQSMSGQLPYKARSAVQMMDLKSRQEPRRLRDAMEFPISEALDDFVAKGLAREPNARFQTAHEALERWRELRPDDAVSDLELRPKPSAPIAPLVDVDAMHEEDFDSMHAKTHVYQASELLRSAQPATMPAPSDANAAHPPAPHPNESTRPPPLTTTDNLTTHALPPRATKRAWITIALIYALTALVLMAMGFGTVSMLMTWLSKSG